MLSRPALRRSLAASTTATPALLISSAPFSIISRSSLWIQTRSQQHSGAVQRHQSLSFKPQRFASSLPNFNIPNLPNVDTSGAADTAKQIVDKVALANEAQLYHWSSAGLAVLFPLGFLLSPSFLAVPVDLGLGIALPVHMHIGLVQIIEDYVPKEHQNLTKLALAVVTVFTTIGLLKINLCGAGISESFKSLWRTPRQNKLLDAAKTESVKTKK